MDGRSSAIESVGAWPAKERPPAAAPLLWRSVAAWDCAHGCLLDSCADGRLFDPFTPIGFENLFTLMWAGAIVIVIGSILVYTTAQRYRRYPAILALHEWIFWSIVVTWALVPLLAVIHVPR